MGKEYDQEGCQAGREEERSCSVSDSHRDDSDRFVPCHRAVVRVVDQKLPPVVPPRSGVTAARIMSTEFPRLKKIEGLKDYETQN